MEAVMNNGTINMVRVSNDKEENVPKDLSRRSRAKKITVTRLAVKNIVLERSISYMKILCDVKTMHVFLPISCRTNHLLALQGLCEDITFIKSPERVKSTNLKLDGFLEFLHVPIIKVQYEVDEKTVNRIIKQWVHNERPNFQGFYALRRGKVDKLAILQKGLESISSQVTTTAMAKFFDISMPDRPKLSIFYNSMCFVVEVIKKPEEEVKPSPLMNLNEQIELNILKHLDYNDYRNLSLTCRKWYQRASTAPDEVKPILQVNYMCIAEGDLIGFNEEDMSTPHLRWKTSFKFKLVKRIECKLFKLIVIAPDCKEVQIVKAVKYLTENADSYKFAELMVLYPVFLENHPDLVEKFYKMFSILTMENAEDHDHIAISTNQEKLEQALTVFRNSMHLKTIENKCPIDVAVLNEILKQWIRKRRRNLESLTSSIKPISNSKSGNALNKVLQGIPKRLVQQVDRCGASRRATLKVAGLSSFMVFCEANTVIMKTI